MLEKPQILKTEPRLTAFIPLTIPRSEIRNVMGPGLQELFAALAAQEIKPNGPWFCHHLKMQPDIFDFQICIPVPRPVKVEGRVRPGRLPSATVARAVYVGPYEGLGDAWGEFMDWIAAEGLAPAENLWECYLTGPESGLDGDNYRTELNRPLVV